MTPENNEAPSEMISLIPNCISEKSLLSIQIAATKTIIMIGITSANLFEFNFNSPSVLYLLKYHYTKKESSILLLS